MIALATGVTTDAASLAAVPQAQAPTRLDTNDAAYYIDGKPATKTAADQLDGERDIASVNVLEGEMVHKLLGANAPSTAILITTKKNRGTAAVKAFNQRIDALTADSKNSLLSKEKIN
ncbi:MAG TPA: hypothetical protein VK364_08160, partial [Hymenobacter sp.]|nr:hypothetical protein [Hymenobacter sp.]